MRIAQPVYEDGTIKKCVLRHMINSTTDVLNFQLLMVKKFEEKGDYETRQVYVNNSKRTRRTLKKQEQKYLTLIE